MVGVRTFTGAPGSPSTPEQPLWPRSPGWVGGGFCKHAARGGRARAQGRRSLQAARGFSI